MDKKPMYLLTYDHGGYILWGDRIEARLDLVMGWLEKYPKLKIGLDYEAFTFDEMARTVSHMDEMTQSNAALAEQSAASARALLDQIERLNRLVSTFRTAEGQDAPMPARRSRAA